MWFVFTTTLAWHMFSVSFTSAQPWFYKTLFTEDVEGFHNHHCLHIWTVSLLSLFHGFSSPLHAPIPAVTPSFLFFFHTFSSKHLKFFFFFFPPLVGHTMGGRGGREWNEQRREKKQRWRNFSPAGSRSKALRWVSVPSKTNRSGRKPSESKLRHKSELLWPKNPEQR